MEIDLSKLAPGKSGVVTEIHTEDNLRARLYAFGFVPGTKVSCCYRSPEKKVTALSFRGTVVALRTRDLAKIRVRC